MVVSGKQGWYAISEAIKKEVKMSRYEPFFCKVVVEIRGVPNLQPALQPYWGIGQVLRQVLRQ